MFASAAGSVFAGMMLIALVSIYSTSLHFLVFHDKLLPLFTPKGEVTGC
jgi:hypothetical protein